MATISGKTFWCLCSAVLILAAAPARAEQRLFESVQATPAGEYTSGIEGPAADLDGNLYVVNFGKQGAIGKLAPGSTASEKFIDLPVGSVGNSIRFARDGKMFIADYKGHNIFVVRKGSTTPEVWFHSDQMNQPNDMTIARDGTIYATTQIGRAAAARFGGLRLPQTGPCRDKSWFRPAPWGRRTALISAQTGKFSMSANLGAAKFGRITFPETS